MKTITDDPEDFFDSGGWSFLDANSDDEVDDGEQLDEEDDVYNPDESEFEENEDSESDYSEESISEDESSDGNSHMANFIMKYKLFSISLEHSLSSSEEEGKDWSELEEEAAKADRNHGEFVDDYTAKKRKVLSKSSHKEDNKGSSLKRRMEESKQNFNKKRKH